MTDASVLADLEARGLVQDCTDRDGLAARLAEGPLSLYYGCDPTADSLHVGNLIGLLVLRRFQDAGHRPVALAGGATGMVGDPSGRSEERNLLDEATLEHNVAAIKAQIARIVDLSGEPGGGELVDNRDWTGEVRFLDFLRDIGKHVTVNTMLARESVKNRLASEHGISFTEFTYMLLQAHDFLRLEQDRGVQLQIGGSDQWGNMLGGVDLIRRVHARPAWVLAWPLLTAPDGTKLGKTTGARIWLDPDRTSPYAFFQHWMGTDDRQVRQFLLQFTLLPVPDVDAAVSAHEAEPHRRAAQRLLAREATALVHGGGEAAAAEEASAILFGAPLADASDAALEAVAREVPTTTLDPAALDAGVDLAELLATDALLATSKGEARRAIAQGGVYVNGERAEDGRLVGRSDLLRGRFVLLRKGKKAYAMALAAL
ncbi:tyrosine--tRNA ligase [Aquihabitans sp. G128]|uniref:tyrosine--tRNA ligase n=1 Tax=Aquihabitans sp. G128 TaxID=2849779 RepID=UPI001C239419|nr:tyrosine--tRNA ligase [Aquihabitans sp. G128]QXC61932.1 tyrosine--tRNA ligase [Aquihabitans sp. G128]